MITLKEFYIKVHGDYSDVISRLGKDERIIKYLNLFPHDESYRLLIENLEIENYTDAFRNIHTIKGMCLNLGLNKLGADASALCELLRPQVKPEIDIAPFVENVKNSYLEVITAISQLS